MRYGAVVVLGIVTAAFAPPQEPRTDLSGDALPAGAVARLGTTRLRQPGAYAGIGFAPDGKTLLSAGSDGNNRWIYRWDVESGRSMGRIPIRELNYMRACAFSADGTTAVSLHPSVAIHVWDAATGAKRFTKRGRWKDAPCVAVSSDGARVAGGDDQVIRIFDATGKEIRKLEGHADYVSALAFSSDGRTLLSAGADFTARLWDLETGEERMKVDHKWAWAVALAPDGRSFAVGGDASTVRRWDVATGRELFELQGHERSIHALAFSPDGALLASGSSDQTIRLWDAASGKRVRTLQAVSQMGASLAFSPDGKILACGLRLWDVATGKEIHDRSSGHVGTINVLAFSPDGRIVASAGADSTIRLWERATSRSVAILTGHASQVNSLAWSPAGDLLVSAGADSTLRTWDPVGAREKTVVKLPKVPALSAAFLSDGRAIASSWSDGQVRFWDARTGEEKNPAGHTPVPSGQAFSSTAPSISPDGSRMAVVRPEGANFTLSISPIGTATAASVLLDENVHPHLWMRWSPEGRFLAVSGGMNLRLYDVVLQKQVAVWKIDLPNIFAFSLDGRFLAASDRGGKIRVIETASRLVVREFRGHTGGVTALEFAPDARLLASAGEDATVLLWDLSSGGAGDDLEKLWEGLSDADAGKGVAAAWGLAALGDRGAAFLADRLLAPPPAVDADALIADLDAERAEAREKAFEALKKLEAEAPVRRALDRKPGAELRARLEALIAAWSLPISDDPGRWRQSRALLAMERIGTPEAAKRLEQLSEKAPTAYLRSAAAAARARLKP